MRFARIDEIAAPETNGTAAALTNEQLNAAYPGAIIGKEIICPNIVDGAIIYRKLTNIIWGTIPVGTN
jgi:hypothetical protein